MMPGGIAGTQTPKIDDGIMTTGHEDERRDRRWQI